MYPECGVPSIGWAGFHLGHQSPGTGMGSRRYSLNSSWPEKEQRYFTFPSILCPQGVPSAAFHQARLEKIWRSIGPAWLSDAKDIGWVRGCLCSVLVLGHFWTAGRGYRERNRGRVPPWSAIFLQCLSMLEVSPVHLGHQQILSLLQLLCPTLHIKTLLPCLLQGHSQRLKFPKQFWISGYNQTLALFSSATTSSSWDHKGNRI